MADSSDQDEAWIKRDSKLEAEWLRQNNVIYGALIGIGVIMVQPFLTAGELDLPAKICLASFALAIPLLAALILVGMQEGFRSRATKSRLVMITRSASMLAAFTGMVAGFWHIWWLSGVITLVSGLTAIGVHSAGYTRLEYDRFFAKGNKKPDPKGDGPT